MENSEDDYLIKFETAVLAKEKGFNEYCENAFDVYNGKKESENIKDKTAIEFFDGFVNSAVRQVGRDGGKVISNQLYGDSHSTPHRLVKGSGVNTSISGISVEKQYLLTRWIGAFLLCWIPYIGSLIVGYRGVFNILSKYRNGVDHNASYQVQDNRTKSGWGTRYGAAKIKTLKTSKEREFFIIKGVGYLIIAILMVILFIYSSQNN